MLKKAPFFPNAITAFGLTCGLFIIFKMNMVDPGASTYSGLLIAAGLLLLAALADMLDGAVARAMKVETDFGGLFDSLADAISFGVAPSVIIMKSLSVEPGTQMAFLVTTSAIVYSLCGVLRLVRFNLAALAAKTDAELLKNHKNSFTGLPIPAAAAAAVAANLFLASPEFRGWTNLDLSYHAFILSGCLCLLGYLMISRWKFPSIKSFQIKVSSFQLVILVVLFAVAIFYGIRESFPIVFLGVAWGYLILGWILSIIRLIAGRRTQSLEDFEPDSDEE